MDDDLVLFQVNLRCRKNTVGICCESLRCLSCQSVCIESLDHFAQNESRSREVDISLRSTDVEGKNSLDLALDEKNHSVAPFSSKLDLNFEIGSTFSADVDARLEL